MTGYSEIWVDNVRQVRARLAETEIIRYTSTDDRTAWANTIILDILMPQKYLRRLAVYGITEGDNENCQDDWLAEGDDFPPEISALIPEIIQAGEEISRAPDEALLSTGGVAREFGVAREQVVIWDKTGILKPWFLTPGGHRRYRAADIARLRSNPSDIPPVNPPVRSPREDSSTEEITRLRDTENLTWRKIGLKLSMSSEGARRRYNKARGDQAQPNGTQND